MDKKIDVLLLLFNIVFVQCSVQEYRYLFEDKKILITGGTGFIGRALITELLPYNPAKIVIFSRDEVKHYRMHQDFKDLRIQSVIGDIRDYDAIYNATKGIDIVIDAAALKRIDLMEYYVYESIQTNVIGHINLIKACTENNVGKALLVSTDKACSPINTYGACKFLAEKLFTNNNPSDTTFLVVRYGNVLQSTGSVIPFFCERIRNNMTIPLTDPQMTRFFITKEQAVDLIFKALRYGKGGEVFVPQIPAFKIVDLIDVLQDIFESTLDVELVGLRPGEKIHEAMINTTEIPRTYNFQGMFVIVPTVENQRDRGLYHDGQLLTTAYMMEYTSQGAVLPKEDLKALLEEYRVLL